MENLNWTEIGIFVGGLFVHGAAVMHKQSKEDAKNSAESLARFKLNEARYVALEKNVERKHLETTARIECVEKDMKQIVHVLSENAVALGRIDERTSHIADDVSELRKHSNGRRE